MSSIPRLACFAVALALPTLLSLSGPVAAQTAPFGHNTIFRYRAFESPQPGWVSPLDPVGGIAHGAGAGDVLAYVRGNGFERLLYTDFDGSAEYLRSTRHLSTVDTQGHDSFTIQAWFRPSIVTGWRTLVSNTEDNRGFSLKIRDGALRGLVRLESSGSAVDIELSGGRLVADRWYYAAFRVDEEVSSYDLRLFLDGDQIAATSTARRGGVRQSIERPMVGAEPSAGAPAGDFFAGSIYAVAIQNYAVGVERYLENDENRDGSRYFGMPSYHDYLDGTLGPDHRISSTIQAHPDVAGLSLLRYAPFLNDSYVPQGVATNGIDRVYLTLYYRDADGANPSGCPPILAELDSAGAFRSSALLLGLRNSDHVGGAAVLGNWLFVPDGPDLVRYDLGQRSALPFDPRNFDHNRHDQDALQVVARFSNLLSGPDIAYVSASTDVDGTPILWVGDFSRNPGAWLLGYEAGLDGSVHAVRHRFQNVLGDVQGVHCLQASAGHLRFYVSRSYGDRSSSLDEVLYERERSAAVSFQPLLTLPAGLEDLDAIGNRLWMVSESGARYYQKRSTPAPWTDLFPFVFAFDRTPPPPLPSPVRLYRSACRSATIALASLPLIGRSYSIFGGSSEPGAGALYLGFDDQSFLGVPLPFALDPVFPGCFINVALDVQAWSGAAPLGNTRIDLPVPNLPEVLGRALYHQWFFFGSTLGASQALKVFLGS